MSSQAKLGVQLVEADYNSVPTAPAPQAQVGAAQRHIPEAWRTVFHGEMRGVLQPHRQTARRHDGAHTIPHPLPLMSEGLAVQARPARWPPPRLDGWVLMAARYQAPAPQAGAGAGEEEGVE